MLGGASEHEQAISGCERGVVLSLTSDRPMPSRWFQVRHVHRPARAQEPVPSLYEDPFG